MTEEQNSNGDVTIVNDRSKFIELFKAASKPAFFAVANDRYSDMFPTPTEFNSGANKIKKKKVVGELEKVMDDTEYIGSVYFEDQNGARIQFNNDEP